MLLSRSVGETAVGAALPKTVQSLVTWNGVGTPPPNAFRALADDLAATPREGVAAAATRLNGEIAGMRSLIMNAVRIVRSDPDTDPQALLIRSSAIWATPEPWNAIWRTRGPITDAYLLAALDLRRDRSGIEATDAQNRIFVATILRTFEIAGGTMLLALLVGFPFAYLVSISSERTARRLMFLVLLPLWTAVLVRALSWTVLLQREGIINHALIELGLIQSGLPLMYNRFAVYIGALHIFLPYMVLPLYSSMRAVSPTMMKAAASLGAGPLTSFRRVYLPQVFPGMAAGALLVFIQCLGVFVIPAMLGGPGDQGLPNMIAFYIHKSLNWGMAAALSTILLASVLAVFVLFRGLSRMSQIKVH